MKKVLTIAAIAALALGVAACSKEGSTDENAPSMDQPSTEMKNDSMNADNAAAPATTEAAKPAEGAAPAEAAH